MALRDLLRPRSLEDIVGQTKAKLAVRSIIQTKTPEHLLLTGPIGTGKTSLALILARMLTGSHNGMAADWSSPSWHHLNSEQCGNKAYVKEVVESANYPVMKIFIFDEAHSLTKQSQTLLLNTLERDSKTYFFFCTNHPMKLFDALRSRCRKVPFDGLNADECAELVKRGCDTLGIVEPQGLLAAMASPKRRGHRPEPLGSPRGILNALESAASGIPANEAVLMELPGPVVTDAAYVFAQDIKRYTAAVASGDCVDCHKRKALKGRRQCRRCVPVTHERETARKRRRNEGVDVHLPGRSLFAVA